MKFVIYYPRANVGDGGATRTMWDWAEVLNSRGEQVLVLFDGSGDQTSRRGLPLKPVRHIGAKRIRVPINIGRHLKDSTLILHSGFVFSNVYVAYVARRQRIPYVVMPQGAYLARNRHRKRLLKRLWRPFERGMLESAAAIHLSFPAEEADVRTIARHGRFLVAPAGVELDATPWTSGGRYIAWFGRYDIYAKGVDLLLKGMALIPEERRPLLLLRGKDSNNSLAEVRKMIEAMRLEDFVRAHGPIHDHEKDDFLRHSMGCVFPSRGESHSIALLEALRLGVPCVVTNTMPIHGDLERYKAAIVIEPKPRDVERGIEQLLLLGPELTERARGYVGEALNWQSSLDRFFGQFAEIRKQGAFGSQRK